jgi:DNA-binding transcriptional MerR regulator
MAQARLSIGDFSRMTYLSVKALRRYHDMGLLVPAVVDPYSRFRYYEPSQVAAGQVIRRFRDLGMPLEQVRDVLQAPDAAARNELIVAHLRQMEKALEHTQQTVASLRALLERPPQAPISVEYRSVAATPALAISELVSMNDFEAWLDLTFEDLHGALRSAGVPRAGPDAALFPGEFFEEERGEVVVFVPVAERGVGHWGRAREAEIPAAELAVAIHDGPVGEIDLTYGALGTFVAEREIGVRGPIREYYVAGGGDESEHRAEVCWPVFLTRGERA